MRSVVLLIAAVLLISTGSCKKESTKTPQPPSTDTSGVTVDPYKDYTTYTIQQGKNYCDSNNFTIIDGAELLDFLVVFDSSCIYTNIDPNNQLDINKLIGFSDCNTHHQVNSARFGWNWMEGKLHLYAYCYYNSVRSFKILATIPLGVAQHLKMYLADNNYIFQVNGKNDTMSRFCSSNTIAGYKLLPYFGGDEPAPHTVQIRIKYQ
ncbi:MAG: hypothetical protein WC756_04560 [Taibaiella sp.]|jgi:hypothetical protein